jgi:hypothetical protein
MGESIVVHLIISGHTDDLKCWGLVFIRIVHQTTSDSGSHLHVPKMHILFAQLLTWHTMTENSVVYSISHLFIFSCIFSTLSLDKITTLKKLYCSVFRN